jgi:hypothetical protein
MPSREAAPLGEEESFKPTVTAGLLAVVCAFAGGGGLAVTVPWGITETVTCFSASMDAVGARTRVSKQRQSGNTPRRTVT